MVFHLYVAKPLNRLLSTSNDRVITMLKYEVNEVPAGLESYYESTTTGTFKLKVEGVVPLSDFSELKNKVNEFRTTNIELKKKNEELSRFEQMFQSGDFSADKINSKVENLALERAAEMKRSYEEQLADLKSKLDTELTRASNLILQDAVTQAALKHGVQETAMEDVLARAKSSFKVEDGKLVPTSNSLDQNGNPFNLDSWMSKLSTTASHLFGPSKGTNAQKVNKPIVQAGKSDNISKISAGLNRIRR